jgi:hypothetical protein
MNELTATPTHASVLYLRLGDFSTRPVVEQARTRAQLEAVVAAGLTVLPERDRVVLDTPDGIALVVFDNALGALQAAERCLDAAAVLPLCIGAGHGAVAVAQGGSAPGLLGDGLHSASVAAGFAAPAQLLVTKDFRAAVARQEPVRQADLVPAGTFSDAFVRTHELFVMDRLARQRRRRTLVIGGAIAIGVLLVAGGIGRFAYRQEGPFALKAEVALAISPGGEVFLDGEPQGPTPPLAELRMRAGAHVVEVRHGDDPPLRRELELKPGQRVELRHVFSPLPRLVFEVSPAGEIFVDGVARGAVGALAQLDLAEGKHVVEIRHPPYPAHRREITLKRGEQVTVRHVFAPAALVFRVTPGGQVFIDGKPRGALPALKKLELAPGRYAVEIRYGQLPPYKTTVTLKPGKQVVIQHEFKQSTFLQRLFKGK